MAAVQQFFTEVRPWAEFAYFVGTIVLAVVAIFGLQQVSLLKRDIRLRSDRAAKEKAIEYSHRYLTIFISLYEKCSDDLTKNEIVGYDGPIGDFTPGSLGVHGRRDALKKALAVLHSWLPAFNELQSIASAFIVGVADERVGFGIIGRSFCHTVRRNYDLVAAVLGEKTCPYWQSIVDLYQLWAGRMTKAELSELSKDLVSRIRSIPDVEIPPIGLAD